MFLLFKVYSKLKSNPKWPEKGGIVVSHREGKTLLYQFNPRYPFLKELEAFYKKPIRFSRKIFAKNITSQRLERGLDAKGSRRFRNNLTVHLYFADIASTIAVTSLFMS